MGLRTVAQAPRLSAPGDLPCDPLPDSNPMRDLLSIVVPVSLSLVAACTAQTRPQRFADWSKPVFAPAEHASRRARVADGLPEGSILLVPSAEGRSHGETFRQLDDFMYLTGLEVPRSLLALDAKSGKSVLFVPATDRRFFSPARRNDFPGRVLAKDPVLKERSGVGAVLPLSGFRDWVSTRVREGRSLAVRGSQGAAFKPLELKLFGIPSPEDVLRRYLVAEFPSPSPKIRNGFSAMARARMVKSPAEIAILREACAVTCSGIRTAARAVRAGIDERGLEGVLESAFKAGGAPRVPFASIIKSGPNSLWPWRNSRCSLRTAESGDARRRVGDLRCWV